MKNEAETQEERYSVEKLRDGMWFIHGSFGLLRYDKRLDGKEKVIFFDNQEEAMEFAARLNSPREIAL